MPKRPEIRRVLIIGSGPIVIGQACEFDYSGVQACKALREEGVEVVLVNSNPATIMTDPEFADRTYVEPVTLDVIEKILEKERRRGTPIDSVLPTLGGQTGLNCAMACHRAGIFEKHGVRLLAATPAAIEKAEDRQAFKAAMLKIGLDVARSGIAHSWEEAQQVVKTVGLPCAIRPGFTLGGTGGGFAHTAEEFEEICKRGLEYSPTHELLIEESLWGWKEFELEVMRDRADNVVIICSIENFDPMGVHTGDSITVAPAQTLTDREYQRMRDASIAIIREIGVETGGSNIQFAVNPKTGRMCVIEMNPRVSRSSALASKATGFPIAKIATKLALGYTLDEIPNDITKTTPACFEPALDYCVVKIPRWNFEKFPEADETLTTQMKSVGEAMAIGRTFKEALQKCIRSMEIKRFGLGLDDFDAWLRHAEDGAARERETVSAQTVGMWERGNAGTEGAAVAVVKTETAPASAGRNPAPASSVATAAKKGKAAATIHSMDAPANIAGLPEGAPSVPTFPRSHVPTPPVAGWRDGEAPADTVEQQAASWPIPDKVLRDKLARPAQGRLYYVRYALKQDWPIQKIHELSSIDPWFLENMRQLVEFERELLAARASATQAFNYVAQANSLCPRRQDASATSIQETAATQELAALLRRAKSLGYSNVQLARVWKTSVDAIRNFEREYGIAPLYRLVDTCAAEFAAQTPYYYSTHEGGNVGTWERGNGVATKPNIPPRSHVPDELRRSDKPKVVVLGGGPNRIGQGIEFDYCCVHAALAAKELGFEAVMINSNPETVSTDYDTSDLLFFEPLTQEDVLNVCERLNGRQLSPEILLLDATGLREHPRDFPAGVVRKVAKPRFELEDALWERIKAELPRLKLREAVVIGMVLSPAQSADSPCQIVYVLAIDERLFSLGFNAENPPRLVNVEEVGRDERISIEKLIGSDVLSRARKLLREARGDLQGVICQFGGQTPLNLAMSLQRAGVVVLGTNPEAIHAAEDREKFAQILDELGLQSPPSGIVRNFEEARAVADRIGYPVLVRPSFVLGGRAMEICNNAAELRHYMANAVEASGEHPILIDRFLSDATEVDVDAVCDGQRVVICGVLEHIEEAGIHSGDSAMTLPPYSLSAATVQQLSYATKRLAQRIGVVGLMNVQFAIKEDDIYVLEVNPRASRTIPFIAKATGIPWAKIAAKVILGKTLTELGVTEPPPRRHIAVKVSVFPFEKFPGVDVVLGPEMRSTGEVMGVDERFSLAFAKAQMGAAIGLPMAGKVFISVNENDRPFIAPIARDLARLGFELVCTVGTGSVLRAAGLKATIIKKIRDVTPNAPNTPNPLELIESGQIAMVLNTPGRTGRHTDEGKIRAAAVSKRIPIFTTITGAKAAVAAIGALKRRSWEVYALQDLWA